MICREKLSVHQVWSEGKHKGRDQREVHAALPDGHQLGSSAYQVSAHTDLVPIMITSTSKLTQQER